MEVAKEIGRGTRGPCPAVFNLIILGGLSNTKVVHITATPGQRQVQDLFRDHSGDIYLDRYHRSRYCQASTLQLARAIRSFIQ
jgi:hypothetical protein